MRKGFTLVEVLIVIGILAAIAGLSVLIGIDSVARGTVHQERDTLVSLLTGARTAALANVNESAHGVHISPTEFISFEGTSFGSGLNKQPVPRNGAIEITGETDIVFAALSGNVLDGVGDIELIDANSTATVEINEGGRIEW